MKLQEGMYIQGKPFEEQTNGLAFTPRMRSILENNLIGYVYEVRSDQVIVCYPTIGGRYGYPLDAYIIPEVTDTHVIPRDALRAIWSFKAFTGSAFLQHLKKLVEEQPFEEGIKLTNVDKRYLAQLGDANREWLNKYTGSQLILF